MGAKLAGYFSEAERIAGVLGRVRLSGLTRMTTTEAQTVEDTPELVERFERSMAALRIQGGREAPTRNRWGAEVASIDGDAPTLRRHIQAYLDLMTQRSLLLGDVLETARRVNEAAASTLHIPRVSTWMLEDGGTRLRCVDLFERGARSHSSGMVLSQQGSPAYFSALSTQRTIAAHDARHDPRTAALAPDYLEPLGIGALLDVPIWSNGVMMGVVCHEHVGGARTWNTDEEHFAYLMSSFVALAAECPRTG